MQSVTSLNREVTAPLCLCSNCSFPFRLKCFLLLLLNKCKIQDKSTSFLCLFTHVLLQITSNHFIKRNSAIKSYPTFLSISTHYGWPQVLHICIEVDLSKDAWPGTRSARFTELKNVAHIHSGPTDSQLPCGLWLQSLLNLVTAGLSQERPSEQICSDRLKEKLP